MDNKSGCLICGEELVYMESGDEKISCVYCNKVFNTNVKCVNNHYVCDACHNLGAVDFINIMCCKYEGYDPIELAIELMKNRKIKMHGPEHHYLVPAVLISSYYNKIGKENEKAVKLNAAKTRASQVPGGLCGFHGACAAGIGTGIFISIITGATPLTEDSWALANKMTSLSLGVISEKGGPRCCKRDSFLAILSASDFVKEKFNVEFEIDENNIICVFSDMNKQCIKEKCDFYKTD